MALMELHSIAKSFGGVRALTGVDVSFATGRVHALLGENGAGKSTLIKILTGALAPSGGTIVMDGENTVFSTPSVAKAAGIAAVYQEPLIYPHLSVLENLFMGREIVDRFGRSNLKRMRERAEPLLAQLEMDAALLDQPMSALSIGYQQLMLIAEALLHHARLIIFDEPTSILSQDETRRLFAIIERLRDADTAVVYITHRLNEISRIADDVTVLRNGSVIGSHLASDVSHSQLLTMMAGERLSGESGTTDSSTEDRRNTGGSKRLEIQDLTVPGYCNNVNWTLRAGCVTGIYGLVGSGRSETALAAFGHLAFESGRVLLDGEEIQPKHPAEAITQGLAYLPEDRQFQGIFADKSVEHNLTSNTLRRFAGRIGRLNLGGLQRLAREVMDRYNIKAESSRSPIISLSGGNQQKVLFSRWANLDLKVLILDEPTRGIDVGTKAEIHDFVRGLAAGGSAITVISSDLDEVLNVSDEIVVMRNGEVVDYFAGEDRTADRVLSAAIGDSEQIPEAQAS